MHISDGDILHAVNISTEPLIINGKTVSIQIDTGAFVSVLSSSQWELLGQPLLQRCSRRLEAFDGHVLKSLGRLSTTLELRGRLHPAELIVVSSKKPYGLLGRDLLDADGEVKKKDGTLRICADYSVHVNEKIKADSYPIPNF